MVVMVLMIILRADILEFVHRAALGAALDGTVARHGQPERHVAVGRAAGAAQVLLVAEALDDDRVVHRACEYTCEWVGTG